jgi:hypothetical protein
MKNKRVTDVKEIFISFIEEGILNPNYQGYIGGRVEVLLPEDPWSSEEIRFFTKKIEPFYQFRDKWDMKKISQKELKEIRSTITKEFRE